MRIFKNNKPLIGMVHLENLVNCENLVRAIERAVQDAKALADAGFDGALIENYYDYPEAEFVQPEQTAAAAIISHEVRKALPHFTLGVQLLLNDYKASFAICKAINAEFSRLDVFVDDMTGKWGDIFPETEKIMAEKNRLCPNLLLLTDIQVKHKVMLDPNKTLETSALQAIRAGSDGIIVTSEKTGEETPMGTIISAKSAVQDFPVIIGAGVQADNIQAQLEIADGAIVGTALMTDGKVDFDKAKQLVEIRNSIF